MFYMRGGLHMTKYIKVDDVLLLLKKRIVVAENKKAEYDTLEMNAFWDGEMRCAQYMLNKVSKMESVIYCEKCGDEILPICGDCAGE
jgi:hypothetical protein